MNIRDTVVLTPPRFVPDFSFPSYAYVGDPQPHPRNHPDGHSRDLPDIVPPPFNPDLWRDSRAYLCGLDLFNHGYYWEAHEEWEGLWIAAGKRGSVSEFMKGLIKLTAAGVKVRQSQPDGVQRHAARAADHFKKAGDLAERTHIGGLELADLVAFAERVRGRAAHWISHPGDAVAIVFDRSLVPE